MSGAPKLKKQFLLTKKFGAPDFTRIFSAPVLYVEASEDADVTNDMKSRTYSGIYLGTTGNIQGTHKVFDIKTGKVKKPRTISVFPMPDRVLKLVNQWGQRSQREEVQNKLEFLNRLKQRYDWDNDDLEDDEGLVEEEEQAHPNIPAQLPGIELEAEQPGETQAVQEDFTTDAEIMHAAAVNAGIDHKTTGVSSAVDEVIVIEEDDDDIVAPPSQVLDMVEDEDEEEDDVEEEEDSSEDQDNADLTDVHTALL